MDNEETRLREELAEARRNAKAWQMYHETCIGPAEGVVLRQRAERAIARATAAESALAEARGALVAARDWWIVGDGANHPEDWPSEIIDAALARAGEQEAGACAEGEKAVQGEPASSGQDWASTCASADCPTRVQGAGDHCYRHYATPPPGEQGKGGGEGLQDGGGPHFVGIDWARGHDYSADVELERFSDGTFRVLTVKLSSAAHPLAPAQPAEHPASGGEEKP